MTSNERNAMPDLVIVGAGIFGLTIAQQAVEKLGAQVTIIDVRDHIGGNAYSYMDPETGAEIHKYGAHLFHTSNERVWDYVNRFTDFTDYVHRVYATHDGEVFPLPINLGTINQFFHASYTPAQAKALIEEQAGELAGTDPANLNDQGISLIGRPLYEAFIKNYTAKQWQTDASELPASIIKRLPVRFNYNNRYFKDTWEGLPKDGYTTWLKRMIDDPRISVRLETDFFDESQPLNKKALLEAGVPVVYTGPVDRYFDYDLGELKWRTVDFKEVRYDEGDHFGCPVMNFSDADVPYTRAIEFKNFNPERAAEQNPDRTVVWEEYSRFADRDDEPYYPINTDEDKALYAKYKAKAAEEPKVVFGGRLGTYAYYDMDQVFDQALTSFETEVAPLIAQQ
ncbi:UDP-galactopyranose mutase [Bifidobacterium choerinum]|uniref:UDP-galactopyranose mutase n=1 Tax=Bifidobacterium choerinum TaxID=35760 RepID=A0A087ADI1_9BIFI|nr:UDP-galactopyranose mutase [Bifidobacterium choerinum]KFI56831.1 UDP-galactopyranose mutase [Bifidobacterium choerinum]